MTSLIHQLLQMPNLEPQSNFRKNSSNPSFLPMPPELQPMNILPSTSGLINPGITTVHKAELDEMVDDDDGPPLLDRQVLQNYFLFHKNFGDEI